MLWRVRQRPRVGWVGVRLTSEIVALDVFQEAHPLVQPAQSPDLFPLDRPEARHAGLVLQFKDLWYQSSASCPYLRDQLPVIPDYAPAVSLIGYELLSSIAHVDHSLLPDALGSRLGSADELGAFGCGKDVVEDASVQGFVLWQSGIFEINNLLGDLWPTAREKILRQLVGFHGREIMGDAFRIDVCIGEEIGTHLRVTQLVI